MALIVKISFLSVKASPVAYKKSKSCLLQVRSEGMAIEENDSIGWEVEGSLKTVQDNPGVVQ